MNGSSAHTLVIKLSGLGPGEKSPETDELRKKISGDCEKSILASFEEGTQIIIYDANNGTKARREGIANRFHDRGIHVIMLGIFSITNSAFLTRTIQRLYATTTR